MNKKDVTFEISNIESGLVLGEYSAIDAAAALDVLAVDAGYSDWAESCHVTGGSSAGMSVRPVE